MVLFQPAVFRGLEIKIWLFSMRSCLLQPTPTNTPRILSGTKLLSLYDAFFPWHAFLRLIFFFSFLIFFLVLADKVQSLFLQVATLNFPFPLAIAQLLRILFPVVFSPYCQLVLGTS